MTRFWNYLHQESFDVIFQILVLAGITYVVILCGQLSISTLRALILFFRLWYLLVLHKFSFYVVSCLSISTLSALILIFRLWY